MAQTIKFVQKNGQFTITKPAVDLTRKQISDLRHDRDAVYAMLVGGEYAPEPGKKQTAKA